MHSNEEYFAAAEPEEIVSEIQSKIREYYDDLSAEGIIDLTRRMHKAYYGGDLSERDDEGLFAGSKVKEEGRLGFLKKYKANHFRNVARHVLQLASSQRINYSPRARNSDYKSLTQTALSKGVLDHYLSEEGLEAKFKKALETSLILLEGWIHTPWDENAGGLYETLETQQIDVYRGDVKAEVFSMLDVVRDITLEGDDHRWLCLRTMDNKYDLAATYPEVAEELLNAEQVDHDLMGYESFRSNLRSTQESGDQTVVWIFYHRPTPALPNGRVVKFVGDVLLLDAPFPYGDIPLNCVKGSDILGTPYAYSDMVDVLGPQRALDIVNTQNATNQFNLGIQNVWTSTADVPSVKQLADGMVLWSSTERPEPLNLTQINSESFKLKEGYENDIERLSGINSTVRGNPPGANMSGAAQALLVAQAVSFNSSLEQSYFTLVSNVGSNIIENLKRFARTPRIMTMLGESKRPFTKEFHAEDLSEITRVSVNVSNPMGRTIAGRIELARLMQEMGISITPYQLNNILETGSIDSAVEGTQHEYLTIRAENEALREGRMVPVMVTDNHPEHINEHKALLADPESRMNPALVQVVTAHIQEHINVWRSTDPALLQMLGLPPAPQAASVPQTQVSEQAVNQAPPAAPLEENQPAQPNLPDVPENAPPEVAENFNKRSMQ